MLKSKSHIAIPPGATIKEQLENRGITQKEFAARMGMSEKHISKLINGDVALTYDVANRLEFVLGMPASFWNNLESSYRESLERKKDIESIKEDEKYLVNIPYSEMAKRNWNCIEQTRDPYEKVINLRKFFSVASLSFDTELKRKLAFRKTNTKKVSFESLYCWLRYGEIQANKDEYPKFNIEKLKENTKKIRELANKQFLEQLNLIKQLLKECGVALIYEPHLPNTYVNGVSYKVTCDKAIIMISDRGKKDDILWFTLFHEIAHLIKHSKKEVFVDLEDTESNDIELEADEFARNILIPNHIYQDFVNNNTVLNENLIKEFAKNHNISTGIVVGRLQKDGFIGWNQFHNLITRI